MSRFALANRCGLVFGALTVLSMLPMSFPDKRAALPGAFFNRFAIGYHPYRPAVFGVADRSHHRDTA